MARVSVNVKRSSYATGPMHHSSSRTTYTSNAVEMGAGHTIRSVKEIVGGGGGWGSVLKSIKSTII